MFLTSNTRLSVSVNYSNSFTQIGIWKWQEAFKDANMTDVEFKAKTISHLLISIFDHRGSGHK